jgi:uncharacterized protein (TIGR00725 family)
VNDPPIVAVFGSSALAPDDPGWEDVVRLGEQLARMGCVVLTGGYGGVMEAVSKGAHGAGGRVIGVTAPTVFPRRSGPNTYLSDEMAEETLSRRLAGLIDRADATVVLPGSIGTLAELVQSWNVRYVAGFGGGADLPVVAVGPIWEELVHLVEARLAVTPGLVSCVATIDEALDWVGATLHRDPDPGFRPASPDR